MNLFPRKSGNIIRERGISDNDVFVPGSIVEKKFSFLAANSLSGASVQELGHHAGYYSLPHTKAARYNFTKLASNLIYVDQPTGTGFSYSSDDSDIRNDEVGVSNDLYDFLQAFFKQHPQFVNNDFYITGESYAGHYIPALASRIHQANKQKQGILINLKPLKVETSVCLLKCYVTKYSKYYDIRKKCEGSLCYDFSNAEKLLNEKTVKKALGVSEDLEYVSCSTTVYEAMERDFMANLEVGIPALLEDGIRFLAYVGEEDLICNWLGNIRWVRAMEWSGQKEFKEAPAVQFKVNGEEAGSLSSHGPLTFLKVYKAGHLVPMDQPEAALDMLTRWMQGKL
ncbi:hypothetical protein PIB30_046374 [Stylosanthes scabra]|uniref:Carboxypeptidase n=1 Tax=Stylosanthes scabra TaxID=79078 RepID=A0ABU6ZF71_9FABA|nr:hypothetical protein [Stylosanthes scabra]